VGLHAYLALPPELQEVEALGFCAGVAIPPRIRRIRIIQGTKIKKKFKTIVYACVYALATTSGMGQWCSAVGARVEQGRQCDLFGHVRPRHVLLIISAREISA
jgi:hypothetical protein